MTKRFTSGGFGRFDFATVNRMMDASERVEGMPLAPSRQERKPPRDTVIGRLLRIARFEQGQQTQRRIEGLPYEKVYLWEWEEVEVQPAAMAMAAYPAIKTKLGGGGTALLGPRRGLAFCLNGNGYANDIVVLHRVSTAVDPNSTLEPESYWCFYEANTIPETVLGLIVAYEPTFEVYTVEPREARLVQGVPLFYSSVSAVNSKWLNMRQIKAINMSTRTTASGMFPKHHGQKMSFAPNPSVQMTMDGEVKGVVLCTLLTSRAHCAATGDEPLYGFDVPNPVKPSCI